MKIPSTASKIIKIVTVIILLVTLYALVGFRLLPAVLTAKLPDVLHQQTGRKASIQGVAFNPFTLKCRLRGFTLQEKNGQPFVTFDSFATKINLWQSFKLKALAIEEVTLSKPFVHVARLKNDNFNFADIAHSKPEKDKKSGKIFPVNISKIAIADGKLFWEDHHLDKSVQEKISPINLDIENFTTNADQESKLGITLGLMSGGKLDWKGKIGVNPITSHGHISLNNIKLSTLLALASPNKPAFNLQGQEKLSADYTLDYVKDSLKLKLNKSKLELIDVKFSKNQPNPIAINLPNAILSVNCTIDQAKNSFKLNADSYKLALQDFQFEQKGQQPVLIKALDMTHEANIALSLANHTLQVTANKDKLDIRELYVEQSGEKSKNIIKIPALVHKATVKINKTDKILQVSSDKTQLNISDLLIKQSGEQERNIEIPIISHEADIQFSKTDKDLQASADQSKLSISQLHLTGQGANRQTLTVPRVNHTIDIHFHQNDKGLQLTANKSRLDIGSIDFKDSGPNNIAAKIASLRHESDLKIDRNEKGLQIAATKSQLNIGPIDFKNGAQNNKMAKIASVSHESDFKLDQYAKDMHIKANKSRLNIGLVDFKDQGPNKTIAKIPSIRHETDLAFDRTEKGLHITANKERLEISNLDFKNAHQSVALPRFSHESDVQIDVTDKSWQVASKKSTLSGQNIQFSDAELAPVLLKIPELALETAYNTDNKSGEVNFIASKGKCDLQKLQLDETGNKTSLAKIGALGFNGLGINLKTKELVLESFSGKNADFKAWLNADKTLNYQALLASKHTVSHQAPKPVKTAGVNKKTKDLPWKIKINQLALSNFGLDFEDRTQAKTIALSARPIDVQFKNFTTQTGATLPLQLSIGLDKTGSIKVAGHAVVEPFSSQLTVNIKNIALDKYQPYIDKFARLDVIDGNFNVDGKLQLVKKSTNMDIKFKGNTHIADLVTRDQLSNKDFVKWHDLSFNGVNADVLSNRYTADLLLIKQPYARVTIRKDKTVNVNDILIADNKAATNTNKTESATQTPASKKPYFKLDAVKIIDGSSDFSDLSLILPFSAPIKGLNGGATGISSEQNSKITVGLEGNAFELSPVKIKGELSPYMGNFDVKMNFDGMPMPLVSPYMVQFAGYKVEKGKLTLGLQYAVEKKQLTATNSILIDQLELGEKVESPNAVSLPLELAITLLKDSSGKIKLDVPLSGSLEDPKFSIGAVMGDALVNVLTKIITSPFNALAGLVGSDEDLSTVVFAAGNDILTPEQTAKLDDVAKALKERPALSIDIKGTAYQEQDWPALRKGALRDQLKRMKANEINKDNVKKIRAEYIELSDAEYNELLADVFIQQFPKQAKKSLFGTPTLTNPEAGDFYSVAQKKMAESLQPDHKRLKDLATDRAAAIAKYLVQTAGISNDRVFILDTAVDPERDNKDITSLLSLKTN